MGSGQDRSPWRAGPGQGPELHDAAFGLVSVRVFEPQSLLRPVLFQVGELFTVDGSTALPAKTATGRGVIRPGSATTPVPGSSRPERPVWPAKPFLS